MASSDNSLAKELVQRTFTRRNQAHLAHWATKSFSEHMALDDFYNSIIGSIDSFVENYQAYYGLLDKVTVSTHDTQDILPLLKEDVRWLNQNRTKIANGVPSLENILDDLTSVYTKTIYKLVNLK